MTEAPTIHGHDIIDLVASHAEGIRISELAGIVATRYGSAVTFHTCSAEGMNLDELLAFLDARDKVRLEGDRVHPGDSPSCNH